MSRASPTIALLKMLLCMATAGALSMAVTPARAAWPVSPITTRTTGDFWWADFDALERANATYRQPDRITKSAESELELFRIGLGNVIGMESPHREAYLRELEALTLQWANEHPASAFAHTLHAQVLVEHGWSYRGNGFSKDVPPLAWEDFRAYLNRAATYLRTHADVVMTDSYAHATLLTIGKGLDWTTMCLTPSTTR